MITTIKRWLCASIKELYLRYVWPVEKEGSEWSPEKHAALEKRTSEWLATVKANAELGTAHVEALCEISELKEIIHHLTLHANYRGGAPEQLTTQQKEKVQAIWRETTDLEGGVK